MKRNLTKNIAIIGNGMVGSTLALWFSKALVFDVDPTRSKNSMEEINNQAEVVFIAVPTPYEKGFKRDFIDQALQKLQPGKIVVVKSTIVPGTTDQLQQDYPKQYILFNPEFLTEKTALDDFLHPTMQIVGYTKKSKKFADRVLKLLPKSKVAKILPAKEAEAVKYFRNCFYATKVVFANQFYDYCQAAGIDYAQIQHIVQHDPMVGENHLEIFHQGGRGAGGKCLPKDLAALVETSNLPLLKKVKSLNQKYLRMSKKS